MDFYEFIISKLKLLAKQFPFLTMSLERNSVSQVYFVEITPRESFRTDIDLNNIIRDIYLEQLEKYPDESLSFISDDSYYKITNPLVKVEPISNYDFEFPELHSLKSKLVTLFNNYCPVIDTNQHLNIEFPDDIQTSWYVSNVHGTFSHARKILGLFAPPSKMILTRFYKKEKVTKKNEVHNSEKRQYAF